MSEVANIPQLRFPEFSGEWVFKQLNEIAPNISYGLTVRPEYVDSGIPLISAKEIKDGCIDYGNAPKISIESFNKLSNKAKAVKGDIFLSKTGTIGRVAYVSSAKTIAITQNIAVIRVDSKIYSHQYIVQFLRTKKFQRLAIKKVNQSTIMDLQLQDIKRLYITLPSIQEQQKIAAFLTAVDNKIELLGKKQALLKEYKKGLMQQIFSQEIRFSPKGTSSQAQGEIDDGSEFADWQEKKLGDVLKRTSTGLNPRQNFKLGYGENYYVTIKNISNGKLDFSKCEMIDNDAMAMIANRSDLSKDDLIMSSIGNVGESYLLDKEPQNWNINESVFMLRASKLILPQFLYFIITNEQSKWYLESNSTGSSFKSIKLGELKLLPLRLPSLEEQTKIANFLSSIDRKIEQVGAQLDKSKQFKKALLQQMFV